ncbi:MAG: M17 family peptidase N-terminal domain-containing protein, partial [Candidatus Thermoplasmatota archaeon]|nr:M17 family peptidase N-terminal domain-containing protein [Candidatus Thermoplasmatota archaeon]
MDWKVSEREETGDVLVLPVWEGKNKPANSALNGLPRSSVINTKSAFKSRFDGKAGSKLSVWGEKCRVVLVGMGDLEKSSNKIARDAGAKTMSSLSKKDGTNLTVRFTTGWNLESMLWFIEGMMLRDYAFVKYRSKDKKEIEEQGEWSLDIQASSRYLKELSAGITRIVGRVEGVHLARDLANEPPNYLYPMSYAE